LGVGRTAIYFSLIRFNVQLGSRESISFLKAIKQREIIGNLYTAKCIKGLL